MIYTFIGLALLSFSLLHTLPFWFFGRLFSLTVPSWVYVLAVLVAWLPLIPRLLPMPEFMSPFLLGLSRVSNGVLGVAVYATLFGLLGWLLSLPWGGGRTLGALSMACLIAVWWYGHVHFHTLKINHYTYASEKLKKPYRLILLADTQLGSLDSSDIARVRKAVESEASKEPTDAILFAGDAVDTGHYRLKDLEALRFNVNTPVYFSDGNHEHIHLKARPHLEEDLRSLGYHTLQNEAVNLGGDLRIIGIQDIDFGKPVKVILREHEDLIDPQHFNLVMYHRPTKEAASVLGSAGADFIFSGHTHAGQIEPVHSLMKLLSTYVNGWYWLIQMDHTQIPLLVTSGAGLWGPRLRIGTDSEIIVLTLTPKP